MNKNSKSSFNLIKIFPKLSIILGIGSIIGSFLYLFPILPYEIRVTLFASEKIPEFLYIHIFIPISLFSLILGIISFKLLKSRKISSILGIIFSTIALIIWLFAWFWTLGWYYGA